MDRPPEPIFRSAARQAQYDRKQHPKVARRVGVVSALVSGGFGAVFLAGGQSSGLDRFLSGVLGAAIGLLAIWAGYYLIYTPFIAPYRQRNVARRYIADLEAALAPPPFDMRLRAIDPEQMTGHPNQRVVRLNVENHGPTGRFRAELMDIEAIRDGSSRIPLEWTNYRGESTLELEGGGTPYQVTIGEMPLSEDGGTFHYVVARTPNGPGADQMRPLPGHKQIRATVRVVNVETRQEERIRLAIGADPNRGPFAIPQGISS